MIYDNDPKVATLKTLVDILASEKIDKNEVFRQLVTNYPEVFLTMYDGAFEPIVFSRDLPAPPEPMTKYPEVLPAEVPYTQSDLPYWARIVLKTIQEGNRISAVKLVKQLCGCGLREAKDYCDRIEDRFRW